MIYNACIPSPLGWLYLSASDLGLERIEYRDEGIEGIDDHLVILQAVKELREYFDGERKAFQVPLNLQGTHFQLNVWEELEKVPFAKTASYADIARRLGDVKVIRAAATANGRNPIPIIVPCHRVIGKDGSLTGYNGGLARKKWLLDFELSTVQTALFSN